MKKVSEIQELSLRNIFHKTAQLTMLQKKIKNFLPEELKAHCGVANFEKGILVFAVENSAWSMRFRYIKSELLSRLRKEAELPQLTTIECYIEPDFVNLFREKRMKKDISSKGFTALEFIIATAVIVFLAELALPHFVNQRAQARTASISAMAYAVNSSVYMSVKKYRMDKIPTSQSVTLNGKTIQVAETTGFPTGNAAGIGAALGKVSGFSSNYDPALTVFQLNPAVNNCYVTYTPSSGWVAPIMTGC